jgi:hypothetical protein
MSGGSAHKIAPPARAATGWDQQYHLAGGLYADRVGQHSFSRRLRWLLNAALHSLPVVAEKHTDASTSVSQRRACIHLQIDRSCSWNSVFPTATKPNGYASKEFSEN